MENWDIIVKYLNNEATAAEKQELEAWLKKDMACLLYTSDAADERSSVDLGGRRIIKKKKTVQHTRYTELITITYN